MSRDMKPRKAPAKKKSGGGTLIGIFIGLILGVVAALTVPLFLNMLSSNLLEGTRVKAMDLFVFAGICLIYVLFTRRLFESVSRRLISQHGELRRGVEELAARQDAALQEMAEALARIVAAAQPQVAPRADGPAAPATAVPSGGEDALAYQDVEILRAIAEDSLVYGDLARLQERTGLSREQISGRLASLKNQSIIETRINDRNVLHWAVSQRGKQLLADILKGQDDRKTA